MVKKENQSSTTYAYAFDFKQIESVDLRFTLDGVQSAKKDSAIMVARFNFGIDNVFLYVVINAPSGGYKNAALPILEALGLLKEQTVKIGKVTVKTGRIIDIGFNDIKKAVGKSFMGKVVCIPIDGKSKTYNLVVPTVETPIANTIVMNRNKKNETVDKEDALDNLDEDGTRLLNDYGV